MAITLTLPWLRRNFWKIRKIQPAFTSTLLIQVVAVIQVNTKKPTFNFCELHKTTSKVAFKYLKCLSVYISIFKTVAKNFLDLSSEKCKRNRSKIPIEAHKKEELANLYINHGFLTSHDDSTFVIHSASKKL